MGSISYRQVIGLSVLVLLTILGFVFSQPQTTTPDVPNDPKAEEALALVRSHPARNAGTLEDAVNLYVQDLEAKGIPHHKGDWQVGEEQPGVYAVRVLVREKGFNEWIQREFAWRVTLKDKTIRVISLAAIHFMPFHELPPLPHQDQISSQGSVDKDRQRRSQALTVLTYYEYAPCVNGTVALLNGHFEQSLSMNDNPAPSVQLV